MRSRNSLQVDPHREEDDDEDTSTSNFNTVRSPPASALPSSLRHLFEDANSPTPRAEQQTPKPFFPSLLPYQSPPGNNPEWDRPPVTIPEPDDTKHDLPASEPSSPSKDSPEHSALPETPPLPPPPAVTVPTPPDTVFPPRRPNGSLSSASKPLASLSINAERPSRTTAASTHQSAYSLDLSPTVPSHPHHTLSPPAIMRTRSATTLTTAHIPGPLNLSLHIPPPKTTESHHRLPSHTTNESPVDQATRGTPGLKDVLKVCLP